MDTAIYDKTQRWNIPVIGKNISVWVMMRIKMKLDALNISNQ